MQKPAQQSVQRTAGILTAKMVLCSIQADSV